MDLMVDEHGALKTQNLVDGRPRRTKFEHPYNYDPIVIYRGGGSSESTIYTDRLYGWDAAKHDRLCRTHFGDEGQYWDRREPKTIESFLRDWTGDVDLKLVAVIEYCNQATGYPVWRLDYARGHQPKYGAVV